MTKNRILVLVLLNLLNLYYTSAMKCYREKSFGDKAFNIYWCKKPPMTICCTEGGKFTCCEDKSGQHLMQQLQIWGSVFGIVFLVVAVYLYYRVENNICDGNKNLKELCMTCCYCKCIRRKSCCCCNGRVKDETMISSGIPSIDNEVTDPIGEDEDEFSTACIGQGGDGPQYVPHTRHDGILWMPRAEEKEGQNHR